MRWSGKNQHPSVHPSVGVGLTFLPTGEMDGGAGADLAFRNGKGGWWHRAVQDGVWVRRRRAEEGQSGQVQCLR